ncbi:MAG: helix-turn-helix domain-containing protein [bacterium]
MKRDIKIRIKAVETYLAGGTLKKIASKFNIHYVTLCKWVKWYKKTGEENFYKKPWNRLSKDIEEKVVLLKENNPSLTIKEAKKIFNKRGFSISSKTVYNIWRRYNLVKKSVNVLFSPFGPLTPEIKCVIEYVRSLLKNNEDDDTLKKAAKILNDLPSYPVGYEDILNEIPERFLSSKRKMERMSANFLDIPPLDYFKQMRKIRKSLEKKGYFYTSITAGLLECIALNWMRTPTEELELLSILKKRKGNLRNPVLNFELTILQAIAYAELLQGGKAHECASKCKKLLRSLPYSNFLESYGTLMSSIGNYKEALHFFQKACDKTSDKKIQKRLHVRIALCYVIAGEYRGAEKISTKAVIDKDYIIYAASQAFLSFGLGKLNKASSLLQGILDKSKRNQLRNAMYAASLGLATIASTLGKMKEAKAILEKCLLLMEKYELKKNILIINSLLGKCLLKKEAEKFPLLHFLYLLSKVRKTMRAYDYKSAFNYAKSNGLLGLFHRWIVFFPEPVLHLLEKGKPSGLPRAILKFPVFNQKIPVYHIKLLSNMVITKNQQYLKIKLTPKEKAFLIHIALKAGEPNKKISLKDLIDNFWSKCENPSNLLSHLLVVIRRDLMIPTHLLEIAARSPEPVLVNRGFYFVTDYNDFEIALAQAKALERAGEWGFAKKEYLRAFALFRGEPFKKMYDNWSENMRRVILNKLETEAIHFAKSCLEHGNRRDAKRVLGKISKIIPGSDEMRKMMHFHFPFAT